MDLEKKYTTAQRDKEMKYEREFKEHEGSYVKS
jgi:hypothetical protein